MFNSLKYAKILVDAGLPRDQAETHIQILGDVIGEEMATKDDIKRLESTMATKDDVRSLRADTKRLESTMATRDDFNMLKGDIKNLQSDIGRLESKITYESQNLEHRMTIKLGGLMAAFLATGLTAAKLLFI